MELEEHDKVNIIRSLDGIADKLTNAVNRIHDGQAKELLINTHGEVHVLSVLSCITTDTMCICIYVCLRVCMCLCSVEVIVLCATILQAGLLHLLHISYQNMLFSQLRQCS